jgi:hypothetical protein
MPSLRGKGVSCRCCGATYAKPHPNEWGLCDTCWYRLAWHVPSGRPTEEEVSVYLVRKVAHASKRVVAGKIVGRCQCISFSGNDRTAHGYQCGSIANYERDGRIVCHAHIKSDEVTYVDAFKPDPFRLYKDLMRAASMADPDFRRALKEVAA